MGRIRFLDNRYYIESDIVICRCSPNDNVVPHTHDFVEFVYMLHGKSLHTVNSTPYPMSSGDLLVVNYDQVHSFTAEEDIVYYNILIKPSVIDEKLENCRDLFSVFDVPLFRDFKGMINDRCCFVRFSPEERNCFEYMLFLLEKELTEQEIGYNLTTHSGISFLLTMIFRKMCRSLTEARHEFSQILDYMAENYAQSISGAELAAMCHYSPAYFSLVFRKHTGMTFSEYLKRLRIRESCRLLLKGSKASDVYARVGYTNKTNFYKHFRQVVGMTPLEYKKLKTNTFLP